ncbi:hypothetical protein AMTR_s00150p00053140 [Amborella trichopoda]|uniref:Uncharacterized protein n=1 Tax=Amborella trichopoda TaxID=13333 RepID=W1PER3_AMBTC|nr:hypothetical protein AMTR_s00150p00053140 [Amborella trichopoda]
MALSTKRLSQKQKGSQPLDEAREMPEVQVPSPLPIPSTRFTRSLLQKDLDLCLVCIAKPRKRR